MKKILSCLLVLFVSIFLLVGCGGKEPTTTENQIDFPTTKIDHLYSNKVNLADANTSIDGKLFIRDKIGRVTLKSVTDGDTAVFHLTGNELDVYTGLKKGYPYVTVRFLGIDTPESTSSIEPWGKKASVYVHSLLENAKGIILDATDINTEGVAQNGCVANCRIDSNGSRWLALVWYTNDDDINDLSKYRLLQLDVIEECYSRYTGGNFSERYVYEADKNSEPKLYNRYEDQWGSLKIGELLLEAEVRMSASKIRVFGKTQDDGFDYSTTPTELPSIKDAHENFDTYASRGTFVAITGVIVRFIGSNFYLADAEGYGLYVYMGINGNAIEGTKPSQFLVGDTINIRGRLCEYGGQMQLSGIEFKKETFKKITDPEKKIPMPEAIEITGNETSEQLDKLIGKLVHANVSIESCGSPSKDNSFSLTTAFEVPDLVEKGASYPNIQIRINGSLAGGYDYNYTFANFSKITEVTGIMSIYSENDVQLKENFPSYQIVVGNKMIDCEKELVFSE